MNFPIGLYVVFIQNRSLPSDTTVPQPGSCPRDPATIARPRLRQFSRESRPIPGFTAKAHASQMSPMPGQRLPSVLPLNQNSK
jgi:hypothetical protein